MSRIIKKYIVTGCRIQHRECSQCYRNSYIWSQVGSRLTYQRYYFVREECKCLITMLFFVPKTKKTKQNNSLCFRKKVIHIFKYLEKKCVSEAKPCFDYMFNMFIRLNFSVPNNISLMDKYTNWPHCLDYRLESQLCHLLYSSKCKS